MLNYVNELDIIERDHLKKFKTYSTTNSKPFDEKLNLDKIIFHFFVHYFSLGANREGNGTSHYIIKNS